MSQINIQNLLRPEPIKPIERGAVSPAFVQGGLEGGQIQLGEAPRLPAKSSEQLQFENLAAIAGSLGKGLDIFGEIAQRIDKQTINEVEAELAKLDAEEDIDPRTQYEKFNTVVKNSSTFISGDTWKDTILAQAQKRFGKDALNKFAIEKYQEDALKFNSKYSGKLDDETFNQEFLPKWVAENPSLEQVPSIQLIQNGLNLANEERQKNLFLNTVITTYQDNYEIPAPVLDAISKGTLTIDQAEEQGLITPEAKLFFNEAQQVDSLIDLKTNLNARLYTTLSQDPAFQRLTESQIKEIIVGASRSLQPSVLQTWNLAKTNKFIQMQEAKKVTFQSRFAIISNNPNEATVPAFKELWELTNGLPAERMDLLSFIGSSLWKKANEELKGTANGESPFYLRKKWTELFKETTEQLNISSEQFGLKGGFNSILQLTESISDVGEGQQKIKLSEYFQKVKYFAFDQLTKDSIAEMEMNNVTDPVPIFENAVIQLFWNLSGTTYNETDKAIYGFRTDGVTPKGTGYFGPLEIVNSEGQTETVTEYSISIDMEGLGRVEIPSLVPTLTEDEINQVLEAAKTNSYPPVNVVAKAARHAQIRMKEGLSPFANSFEMETFIEVDTEASKFAELILKDTDSKTTQQRLLRLRSELEKKGVLDEFEKYLEQSGFGNKLDLELVRRFRELKIQLWNQAEQNLSKRGSTPKSEKGNFAVKREQASLLSNPEKLIGTARKLEAGELDLNNESDRVTAAAVNNLESDYGNMIDTIAVEAVLRNKDTLAKEFNISASDVVVLGEAQLIPLDKNSNDAWKNRLEFISEKLEIDRERAYDLAFAFNRKWYTTFKAMNNGADPGDVSYLKKFVQTDGFNPDTLYQQILNAYNTNNTGEVTSLLSALEYHFETSFASGVSVSDPQIANFQRVFDSWLRLESLGQIFEQASSSPKARTQGALTIALLRATTRNNNSILFWGDPKQIDSQYMTILGQVLKANPISYDPAFIPSEMKLITRRLFSAGQTEANKKIPQIPEKIRSIVFGPPSDQKLLSGLTHGQLSAAVMDTITSGRASYLFPYLLTGDKQIIKPFDDIDKAKAYNRSVLTNFLTSGSGIIDPNDSSKELSVSDYFNIPIVPENGSYNGLTGLQGQVRALQDALDQPGFELLIRGLVAFNFPSDSTETGTVKEIEIGRNAMIRLLAQVGYHRNTKRKLTTSFNTDGSFSILGDNEKRLANPTSGNPGFSDHFDAISFVGDSNRSPTGIPFLLKLPDSPDLQSEKVGRNYTFNFVELFSGTEMRIFSNEKYTPISAAEFDEQFNKEHQKFMGMDIDYGPEIPTEHLPPIAKQVTPEESLFLSALSLPANSQNLDYLISLFPDLRNLKTTDLPNPLTTLKNAWDLFLQRRKPNQEKELTALDRFKKTTENNLEDESIYDFLRWHDQTYNTSFQTDVLGAAFNPNVIATVSPDIKTGDHILQFSRKTPTVNNQFIYVRLPERNINLGEITPPKLSQVRMSARRQNPQNKTNIQQRAMYQRVFLQAMRYQYTVLREQALQNNNQ